MPHNFEVDDRVRFAVEKRELAGSFNWNTNRYHDLVLEGNEFTIARISREDIYLADFRGYTGQWPAGLFELISTTTPEVRILRRIQKLYKRCPTTKHWEVNCG